MKVKRSSKNSFLLGSLSSSYSCERKTYLMKDNIFQIAISRLGFMQSIKECFCGSSLHFLNGKVEKVSSLFTIPFSHNFTHVPVQLTWFPKAHLSKVPGGFSSSSAAVGLISPAGATILQERRRVACTRSGNIKR